MADLGRWALFAADEGLYGIAVFSWGKTGGGQGELL
jgi:hypothetical protein